MKLYKKAILTISSIILVGCSGNDLTSDFSKEQDEKVPITLNGHIDQEYVTRADQNGFADGDKIGTYIVDYVDGKPGQLLLSGNRADNLYYTFNEAGNRWVPSYDVYFKDQKTPVDIYGYYPSGKPESVEAYSFEVQKNQRAAATNEELSGYEKSDFLWAKTENKTAADKIVWLNFSHRLAAVRVSLVEGTGFESGEWAGLEKDVVIQNVVTKSTVNLATGVATPVSGAATASIIPVKEDRDYRAIVVPQTVASGSKLITATVGGYTYDLVKDEAMTYAAGKQHNFTLTVNKRAAGNYEFVLSDESITVWENDKASHDGIAKEYVVINVGTPGTLDACISAAGLEISRVSNLKLTGTISARDFGVMKYMMTSLHALNLKDVKIVKGGGGSINWDATKSYKPVENDDEIPAEALNKKTTLTTLILPDKLVRIKNNAFSDCSSLTGSLIIPEGVVEIDYAAFGNCTNFNGQLSLPSTLKILGRNPGYIDNDDVFRNCGFVGELKLPESLEVIGVGAFRGCKNLHGELRIPEGVKSIGDRAFMLMSNMKGSITIPQGVTVIPFECFWHSGFNGTLTLHDGITVIGSGAFSGTSLRGELHLPKNLSVIGDDVFNGCDFSGTLVLPKSVMSIGARAFAFNWRLMGTIEFPEGLQSIGAGAFAQCRSLEGLIFPESLESIQADTDEYSMSNGFGAAFQDCFGIGRIVCKGKMPPYAMDEAFNGVPKDNFTL